MSLPKPRLRAAPAPDALAIRQREAEALLQLSDWTEEPSRTPLPGAGTEPLPIPLTPPPAPAWTPPAARQPDARRPWHTADAAVVHAYNIQLPKPLQHKLDFCWKREGYKSMKEFIVTALTAEADRILRELGEKP